MNKEAIEKAVYEILIAIGENPNRKELLDTPERVARMYEDIFSGIGRDPTEGIKTFEEKGTDGMIVLKDIRFHSVCEHHLIPFFGRVAAAYIPKNGKIVGLGKIARIVDIVSKRPQMQERLTREIGAAIMKGADAAGVAVMVEAEHLCMNMIGAKKPGAKTITTEFFGVFKDDPALRAEAIGLIKN